MFLSCDDLKLCTDRIAYSTDNPLGGRRCRYRAKGECQPTNHLAVSACYLPGGHRMRPPANSDEHVAETATLLDESSVLDISCLTAEHALIYLLGTDHVNPKCQKEVSKIISLVRPDKVVVELCKLRACRCPNHMNSVFQNPAHFTFRYVSARPVDIYPR